jgi:hypothetical protein
MNVEIFSDVAFGGGQMSGQILPAVQTTNLFREHMSVVQARKTNVIQGHCRNSVRTTVMTIRIM